MPEQPQNVNWQELAQKLREADHLGPQAQHAVADLLDELSRAIPATSVDPQEAAHLAASASHLADALRQPREANALRAALQRFEGAVARAEARAPLASGIASRIIETLANLGI